MLLQYNPEELSKDVFSVIGLRGPQCLPPREGSRLAGAAEQPALLREDGWLGPEADGLFRVQEGFG